jgi:hypothetical protein
MFSKRLYSRLACLLAVGLLMSLLGACSLPSDEPCTEDELVLVADLAPQSTVVDTLTPVLTWSYPDPSCQPGLYEISIYDQDIVPEFHGDTHDLPGPIHVGVSYGPYYSIPASAGLRPGNTYGYQVAALTADHGGMAGSVGSWFSTGPRCGDDVALERPIPTYPPDGAQVYFPTWIHLRWNSPMSCWPDGNFYVQISEYEDFIVPSGADSTGIVFTGSTRATEFIWISNMPDRFEDCKTYYWRVRAEYSGSFSEIWSFVPRRTEAVCGLSLGGITPIPDYSIPMATLLEDAVCWSGPSLEYSILDYLTPGQQLEIRGRDPSSTWWYVDDPALHKACWVYGERVEVTGDLSQVAVVQPSPVPTRTPTNPPPVNCGQYANPNACGSNSACWWDPNDPPNSNGSCKRK